MGNYISKVKKTAENKVKYNIHDLMVYDVNATYVANDEENSLMLFLIYKHIATTTTALR